MADRRDLNRFFPGTPHGSSASRIAYSFFNEVIQHCNFLIDLHTGSAQRTNLPQIRADLSNTAALSFAKKFDDTVILHSDGLLTLRDLHEKPALLMRSALLIAGKLMAENFRGRDDASLSVIKIAKEM